jgi:hypothetical protein
MARCFVRGAIVGFFCDTTKLRLARNTGSVRNVIPRKHSGQERSAPSDSQR